MKYFIFVLMASFISLSSIYADEFRILCNDSFLRTTTSGELANMLSNISRPPRNIWEKYVFPDGINRAGLMFPIFRQICDEVTGDTPVHRAARVATDFGVVFFLMEEEKKYYPQSYVDHIVMKKNKRDETAFDILRNRVIEDLDEQAINNLDALLDLYADQRTATGSPLRKE